MSNHARPHPLKRTEPRPGGPLEATARALHELLQTRVTDPAERYTWDQATPAYRQDIMVMCGSVLVAYRLAGGDISSPF
jgi:hypothetical protein